MSPSNQNPKYGLITIGNALVDVLAETSEDYIAEQKKSYAMEKGSMNLVDAERALTLYEKMANPLEKSGGSAGNTMACFASLGGKGAYIGKVADDTVGETFASDLKNMGVHFDTAPLLNSTATGVCMILITPDGERTMNTFLGAAVELTPDDIDAELIADAQVTYLEGYLFDPPKAMEAFIKAAREAHKAGRQVALTLSDSFCVDRHREAFIDLVTLHTDILFANEDEIKSLYEVETVEEAIEQVKTQCALVAITRSEKGSIIIQNDEQIHVHAEPVARAIDTTGAGDAYAAGFLFGYTEGKDLATCGRYGSISASEVISHIGPRPEVELKTLIQKKKAA